MVDARWCVFQARRVSIWIAQQTSMGHKENAAYVIGGFSVPKVRPHHSLNVTA